MQTIASKGIAYVGNAVEIKPSTIPEAGLGLFARLPFNQGDYITEYDGWRMHKDEARSLPPEDTTHFRTLDSHIVIAGFTKPEEAIGWGGASFANDRRSAAENNSKFVLVWDKKLNTNRVFLAATSKIDVGDEICVSYGNDYWKKYE